MSLIALTIPPREKDLGGFTVRRLLPYAQRRMVGPFIFFDHMGPAHFAAHQGIDVRPHPHIGLATVTYLLEGEILHRDTLGSEQRIQPGAVNWMTAGRGIAHSERTAFEQRRKIHAVHGLQSWVALPKDYEETTPEFHHHSAATLPEFSVNGAVLRLIAGSAYGHESPVKIFSPLFYAEVNMPSGGRLALPDSYKERAIYVIEGRVRIGDTVIEPKGMPVFSEGEAIMLEALDPVRMMLLGGDPLTEPRFIWWNFVSSAQERIEQAKNDWQEGRFGTIPGDSVEFIPLPEA